MFDETMRYELGFGFSEEAIDEIEGFIQELGQLGDEVFTEDDVFNHFEEVTKGSFKKVYGGEFESFETVVDELKRYYPHAEFRRVKNQSASSSDEIKSVLVIKLDE